MFEKLIDSLEFLSCREVGVLRTVGNRLVSLQDFLEFFYVVGVLLQKEFVG